jgi:hypothetical protein
VTGDIDVAVYQLAAVENAAMQAQGQSVAAVARFWGFSGKGIPADQVTQLLYAGFDLWTGMAQPQSCHSHSHVAAEVADILDRQMNEAEQPDEHELEQAFNDVNEDLGPAELYAVIETPADIAEMIDQTAAAAFEAMTLAGGGFDHSNPQHRAY